jgi:hypothetical protein
MDERATTDAKAAPGDDGAGKPIDALRGILARAEARDQELREALIALAKELLSYLGIEDATPVWSALKPESDELAIDEHFVITPDHWFRGDLEIEIAAGHPVVVNLMVREVRKGQHEVALRRELSQAVVIDPPDEKARSEHHRKFLERTYASIETHIRRSVSLPAP